MYSVGLLNSCNINLSESSKLYRSLSLVLDIVFHCHFRIYLLTYNIPASLFSVSIVTSLRWGGPVFGFRQGQGFFLLATASRPALGPTQPPLIWASGALFPGINRTGPKLTTHSIFCRG